MALPAGAWRPPKAARARVVISRAFVPVGLTLLALNFKDPETDRLARVRARNSSLAAGESLSAIIERGRKRPMLDERTPERILGYDAHGLPA